MTIDLVLSPRDGLTLKDPRGFNLAGGVTAGGLPWPGPATTAGAARAAVGRRDKQKLSETYGEDEPGWRALAARVRVLGPIVLVKRLDLNDWAPAWPAPQDALRLPHPRAGEPRQPEAEIHWLTPQPPNAAGGRSRGVWTGDEGEIAATESLWFPRQVQYGAKPLEPRRLWSRSDILKWLLRPQRHDEVSAPQPRERVDVHLAMDPDTLAAKDEALYALPTYEPLVRGERGAIHELGLGLRVSGIEDGMDLTRHVWRIGGEGRFATAARLAPEALAPPDALTGNWQESHLLRLMTVTPARFETGWRPDWLFPVAVDGGIRFEGLLPILDRQVTLRAAYVERPWWASGWDLARYEPKPSVAHVPAGAVYYLESLAEPFTAADIEKLWLASIQVPKDPERPETSAGHDGFGLVLPGSWPANP
jgi:CRISPR-associated protein Cmr3